MRCLVAPGVLMLAAHAAATGETGLHLASDVARLIFGSQHECYMTLGQNNDGENILVSNCPIDSPNACPIDSLQLDALNAQNASQAAQIVDKENQIASQAAQLAQQENQIAALNAQIASQAAQIAAQAAQIANQAPTALDASMCAAGTVVAADGLSCTWPVFNTTEDPAQICQNANRAYTNIRNCDDVPIDGLVCSSALFSWSGPYIDFKDCNTIRVAHFRDYNSIILSSYFEGSALQRVSFPLATGIEQRAFAECSALEYAFFPEVDQIGEEAFGLSFGRDDWGGVEHLTVHAPKATTIGEYAFYHSYIRTATFPQALTIGAGAFQRCDKLHSGIFPLVVTIGAEAFEDAGNLGGYYYDDDTGKSYQGSVSFPSAQSIGTNAFKNTYAADQRELGLPNPSAYAYDTVRA